MITTREQLISDRHRSAQHITKKKPKGIAHSIKKRTSEHSERELKLKKPLTTLSGEPQTKTVQYSQHNSQAKQNKTHMITFV